MAAKVFAHVMIYSGTWKFLSVCLFVTSAMICFCQPGLEAGLQRDKPSIPF